MLAGLAFMVTVFYLWRRNKPIIFAAIPMLAMIVLPIWAMSIQMVGWYNGQKWLLFGVGACVMLLQAWMIVEALMASLGESGVDAQASTVKHSAGTNDIAHLVSIRFAVVWCGL